MKKVLLMNNQGATYGLPLSDKAIEMLEQLTGIRISKLDAYIDDIVKRDCPALIEVVEELGKDAFEHRVHETEWKIVEIPDDMRWGIAFRDNGDEILYNADTTIIPDFEWNHYEIEL